MLALASLSPVSSPMLRAQDSTITIKDPAEFNTYQMAVTQSNPTAKASALESFLQTYPQSVVKGDVLDRLLDAYYPPAPQGLGDGDKALSAATRLLQLNPNNLKAILYSVFIKKSQCAKTMDVQTCDDAAALSRKGLLVPKPSTIPDTDWKAQTGGSYPVFHSAIAFDDAAAHKDFKGAIDEYTQELMLYTDDQAKSSGLQDTLLLAQAYSQPGPTKDLTKAIWFYARVWNFVPAGYKANIEKQLDYYYTKFHGNLDGLGDVKAKAALTTFPSDFVLKPAETPQEKIHDLIVATPDLQVLNLGDKETVLAIGAKEDADKLWSLLKDQATPVPGMVIDAPASAVKVIVTQGVKADEFIVKLAAPVACGSFVAPGAEVKDAEDYIQANGAQDDATAKLTALFADPKPAIKKIVIEPVVGSIKMAVTQDAKASKTADFIVNLKTSLACKDAPAAGFNYGISSKGEAELDGVYDTFKQIPATDTVAQSAEIVLRDGTIIAEKKKPAGAAHAKPSAAHHAVKQ
jgi:tetratricopeptide (TPR) repeat protein